MRIIRFLDDQQIERVGCPTGDGRAQILAGNIFSPESLVLTDEKAPVKRLLAPIQPVNIFCIGLNYGEHAKEGGQPIPTNPVIFMKPTTAVIGPGEPIRLPAACADVPQVDYECELAVVIGRMGRDIPVDQALEYVLGYTCAVDVTARDKQRTDLQWVRAKSADGFCPVGPWLETDVDPRDVGLRTVVNGQVRQEARTSDMIFPVAEVLSYVSRFMTLNPGDLVLTGTPEGVGRLEVGDVIEVSVEGVGTLVNQVAAEEDAAAPVSDAGAEEG